MRVAVFRAADDGRRTALRLAERGHVAVLAPVIRIVPTGDTVRAGTADALIFTSSHAPEALASHPEGLGPMRDLQCWCVGSRTAAVAKAVGFERISTAGGNVASLVTAIARDRESCRFVLVVGRDRKPDAERDLSRLGLRMTVVEAYRAEAADWDPTMSVGMANVDAALHYSRRSAELAHHLACAAGLQACFAEWSHYCLSEDVAAGLRMHKIRSLGVAPRPTEESLLSMLP